MDEKPTPSSGVNTANPQVIFSWIAPLRPYKKRSRTILRFYVALTLLLSIIIYFFQDKILLIPVWALLFLFYILTITPPPDIENKITKFGVESMQNTARWEYLSYFYYGKRFGYYVLTLVGNPPYYPRFYLVVPSETIKNKLTQILSEHIVFMEHPKRGFTERMIDLLSALIPDDSDEKEVRPVGASKHEEVVPSRQTSVPM